MVASRPPSTSASLVLPGNVRPGQVISLVEVTGGMGPKLNVPRIADEMGADIDVLFPIINAAEVLGLVKLEKGDLCLTDVGLKFQKTSKNKLRTLKERLAGIEPFRTAVEIASKKRIVTAREVADALAKKGVKWHYRPEVNESIINDFLIHWSIYAGLLSYVKAGVFQRA